MRLTIMSRNQQSVDTLKFREDHLNAVVSVKVSIFLLFPGTLPKY